MLKHRSVVAFVLMAGVAPVMAHGAPRGEAKATFAGKAVVIDYGRPSLAGRDMLGKAEVGTPWRMGADGPTTLTTEADLTFGKAQVPKGSYVLKATKTAPDQWALNILQKDGSQVTDVPFVAGKLAESVETFTVEIHSEKSQGDIELKWGVTSLKATFTAH